MTNNKFQINTNNKTLQKFFLWKLEIGNWKFPVKGEGFTLIELLVVITIIGVLTTLVTTNFVGVRQRARDAQRKADIRQIQSALELYRSDNGTYPIRNTRYLINQTADCPLTDPFEENSTVYMAKMPCDPLGTSVFNLGNYHYYSLNGTVYALMACLENASDRDTNAMSDPPDPVYSTCASGNYFVVTNP